MTIREYINSAIIVVLLVLVAITNTNAEQEELTELQHQCLAKAQVGELTFNAKAEGSTLEEVLTAIRQYYKRPPDERIPHYAYIEYERQAQDLYRHPELTLDEYLSLIIYECLEYGF